MNKLQEAAEAHANHFNNGQYARIVSAFKQGAQYQSGIDKEAIQGLETSNAQLLQQNKELKEALETLLQNGFQVDFAFGEHLRDLVKIP